jgi:hypothetical protein
MDVDRTGSKMDLAKAGLRASAFPLSGLSGAELARTCSDLDARGIKYTVVNGVPVAQQGFKAAVKGENLFEQCLEMNRQAVVRSPQLPKAGGA